MLVLKFITTSMIGSALLILIILSPQFKDRGVAQGCFIYAIITMLLSLICMWWR